MMCLIGAIIQKMPLKKSTLRVRYYFRAYEVLHLLLGILELCSVNSFTESVNQEPVLSI